MPTVYLKEVPSISDDDARQWHRILWNHGVAPILVVADPHKVHVYSAWATPAGPDDKPGDHKRLADILDRASDALELQQLVRSIETGHFYSKEAHGDCFDRAKAVDGQLLSALEAVRKQLTTGARALPGEDADALLTRTIFVCYLIAREVICGAHYPDSPTLSKIDGEDGLRTLIGNSPWQEARGTLFDLFERLSTFNGSLFDTDMSLERERIRKRDMAALQAFLKGDNPGTGQLALGFSPYNFSIIPVETISAIYEKFIEAGDQKRRRQTGAYYTPTHLVELVVDQAIEGWDSLLDKKALDVATGSGIFLVSLFNRMAEQWRREHPGARNSVLAKGLTDILSERLCGVDVSPTACRIATFSLYLALLDQLDPRDIQKLQSTGWKLPPLLRLSGSPGEPSGGRTIVQGNFFDPELPVQKGAFDLVVGNPPWVSRGEAKYDSHFAPWCHGHKELPIPEKQMAHGFMWRAPEHLAPGGRGCLVLPAAVLLNGTSNEFQSKWFRRFAVEKVTQLSDLSFVLFVGSDRPAVVVRFKNEPPVLDEARILYVAPKADPQSLRGGPPRVFDQDFWHVRQSEVILQAAAERAPLVWKERLWGTPRDLRFLDRLMDLPPLDDLAGAEGSGKPWLRGVGFKPLPTKRRRAPVKGEILYDAWWPKKRLFLEATTDFSLVVVPGDSMPVGDRFRRLIKNPTELLFSPPMVLFNRGFTKVAFCNFPVLFRHWLHSIAGRPKYEQILRFLAATLASDLATYFLFNTAASWGTERDQAHVFEVLRMPFPLPGQTANPARATEIVAEVSTKLTELEAAVVSGAGLRTQLVDKARSELWPLIREYYDIDDWEQVLIEDTLGVSEKSSTPGGPGADIPALRAPERVEQEQYADLLCQVLNTWGAKSGYTVNRSVVAPRGGSVGVITLTKDRAPQEPKWSGGSQELNEALVNTAKLLPQRQAGIEMVRGMKVFDKNELHIVKPLMLRFWTRTAALNDADEIACAILQAR